MIPPAKIIPAKPAARQPFYHTEGFDIEDWYNETGPFYSAGWGNFHDPEPGYRAAACMHGGRPYSGALKPQPGKQQTMTVAVGNASREYAAIFTFDKQENMSAISSIARAK